MEGVSIEQVFQKTYEIAKSFSVFPIFEQKVKHHENTQNFSFLFGLFGLLSKKSYEEGMKDHGEIITQQS